MNNDWCVCMSVLNGRLYVWLGACCFIGTLQRHRRSLKDIVDFVFSSSKYAVCIKTQNINKSEPTKYLYIVNKTDNTKIMVLTLWNKSIERLRIWLRKVSSNFGAGWGHRSKYISRWNYILERHMFRLRGHSQPLTMSQWKLFRA